MKRVMGSLLIGTALLFSSGCDDIEIDIGGFGGFGFGGFGGPLFYEEVIVVEEFYDPYFFDPFFWF